MDCMKKTETARQKRKELKMKKKNSGSRDWVEHLFGPF